MPYWENVMRSFGIVWRHKYPWLLALFAGEGGSGFSFQYRQQVAGPNANLSHFAQQVSTWINQHIGLLVAVAIVWLILAVALFFLAAVCEGALIRAAAEHDADRPFGLGPAWATGVRTMWLIVRFRLLLFLLALPAVLIISAIVFGAVLAGISNHPGIVVALVLVAIPLALLFVVYAIYLSFLDRFGARIAILEQQMAVPSLRRAHHLLFQRFGRSLLVWLLSIAVAFVVAIASAVVLLIAAIPLIVGLVTTLAGSVSLWPLVIIGAVIVLVVALPMYGFLNGQSSTYWTLSFRRLEIDYPPAYAYPPQPAPQP